MSKIKNGGLDQYGPERFEQQQFGTSGVEGINSSKPILGLRSLNLQAGEQYGMHHSKVHGVFGYLWKVIHVQNKRLGTNTTPEDRRVQRKPLRCEPRRQSISRVSGSLADVKCLLIAPFL